MTRLLDEVLPDWDVNEVHAMWFPVAPERAYAAVRRVTVREIRLLAPLMFVRLLPAALLRRRLPAGRSGPVLDAMVTSGFTLLGERPPQEVAIGVAGRFWLPAAGESIHTVGSRDAFVAFDEPRYAKAASDFRVIPERGGSRVVTETRVIGTDADATRLFRRYWAAIRPGSGLIRASWLHAIGRRAGRGEKPDI